MAMMIPENVETFTTEGEGQFYKFLEAACLVLSQEDDPELEQIIELSIDAIGRAQRDDGYIHAPVLIAQRNGDQTVQPFQNFKQTSSPRFVVLSSRPLGGGVE